jgi:hypothetical protein
MIGNMLNAQKVASEFLRKICLIIFGVFKSSFFLSPTISGVSQFEYVSNLSDPLEILLRSETSD